ncbi:uncharacterized protein LOC124420060 isoform X1 [Lucilia cuprina]|uniref:uncharacterized protein LOC124420060 isoform X1 n=1 Tax=Lucilia cuprina TaxID=7375 RepID=UPI001F05FF84|nr:uncharacterized protein LOC124420060 isoform X1 [Lucilia cuprina]
MLFIKILIKTLIFTKVCLSLTIYQPKYLNYKGLNVTHSQKESNNVKCKDCKLKLKKTVTLSPVTHYQAGAISNIFLSQTSALNDHQQPGYSNIYPVQYHFNNPLTATLPKTNTNIANVRPVLADSLESEILHATHEDVRKPTSSVNYNNQIYHINTNTKRASPLTNNNEQENARFFLRKQRNLRENLDDKLIEQNNKEIQDRNDVNDQQYAASSTIISSLKQPSSRGSPIPTTKTSSHEIRYLHDIFLNYPKPHHVNTGHVELSPVLFEKRFESQKAGNRYKGEVLWLDNSGGFAQHTWDLAQGKL